MSDITTKLKVLGEKWANLPDCKEANEIADEVMGKLPEVLSRIEELEKACAEMRCALKSATAGHMEYFFWSDFKYHALSTSCGSDYIHRDEVRPLVDALRYVTEHRPHYTGTHQAAQKALTHAEKLLKGEKE